MQETIFVRFRLIVIGLGLLALVVVVQLLRIQFGNPTYFTELSDTIGQRQRVFDPARGRIFDRNGELLAGNDTQYELGISPAYVVQPEEVARTLSGVLDKSMDGILAATESESPYVLIARPVSGDVGDKLKQLEAAGEVSFGGVSLSPIAHRVYPGGTLGAQILGFVAYNLEGRQLGYFGVEGFYNDLLAGKSIKGMEKIVPFDAQPDPTPDEGADLYLTIDREIQFLVEQTLVDALQKYGADSGSIVVMDPRNGEILGMASYPTFDPNKYTETPPTNPANPAVSGQYEPGSTFKILTMAAALDSGIAKSDTSFVDRGFIEVGGVPIRNWDGGAWGATDMVGCLQHSLNVCMASLSTQMGTTTFYNYMSAFGIGHVTRVDLDAEAGGRLKLPGDADWFESDLGTNAFGQGVAVTPLQLLTAASAIANGGKMMQPHILLKVQNGNRLQTPDVQVLGRPIKPETAATLSEMLAQSLERGEGDQALVEGYRVAGKTGTAQIPIPGGYDQFQTIASFVGWGPVDAPRFIVLVKLDKPSASIWGSETAAPVFSELVKRLVVLLDLPPDVVRRQLQGQ